MIVSASVVVGMGVCVYLAFFCVWFSFPWDVATALGKYLRTILDVNPSHSWRNLCQWNIFAWTSQFSMRQHVGIVSVLLSVMFDACYCSVIIVVALVKHWAGQ